jgi:hypothetical protein
MWKEFGNGRRFKGRYAVQVECVDVSMSFILTEQPVQKVDFGALIEGQGPQSREGGGGWKMGRALGDSMVMVEPLHLIETQVMQLREAADEIEGLGEGFKVDIDEGQCVDVRECGK